MVEAKANVTRLTPNENANHVSLVFRFAPQVSVLSSKRS